MLGLDFMITRLLMSDIADCISANPRYFLLWSLSSEAFKLAQRFIFFFIFIFIIKKFLIEKEYLGKTAVEIIFWVAPYLFTFSLGTVAVALLKKYSRKAEKKFNNSLRAPIFQKYHKIPRSRIVMGLKCFVAFLFYLLTNFIVNWSVLGTMGGAIVLLGATALICVVLFASTSLLTPHTTALLRAPFWNLIEGMVLILYFSVMMCIVILMEIETNVGAIMFIILIPRQLISSLIGCAQSFAFFRPQQVAA